MSSRKKVLPQPIRLSSLANQVFDILKEAIFTGRFQPGEPLRELHLARMLDVSQATVREALVQLEQAGLVVRMQNRKTTVTSFTQEEVRDRLAMRVVLEEFAFVKAAELMESEQFAEIAALANAIEDAIHNGDAVGMTLADMRFHRYVWERANSPVLLKTLDQLTTPLFAFLSVLHASGLHDLKSGRPHDVIVKALRSRKADVIRKAIRNHIESSYQGFLKSQTPSLDKLVHPSEPQLSTPER